MVLGNTFYGTAWAYCGLLNETMNIDWTILDSSNSSVDSGSINWTGATIYTQHNITSATMASAGVGTYALYAEWSWWNTSASAWELLDTDYSSFAVFNNSGGGNSSGTNCAVYAWSDFYSYMVGDNFYGEIDTYCSLTNETLWVGWDIVNVDSNSTVDTGSLSWTTTQWHETQYLNTTSLVNVSAGNYSFDVELKWWNTSSSAWETLDSDSDPFVVYTSTGGGGNSSGTNCAVYAWSDFYSYMVGDNFYGEIDTYCSLTNETLWAGWDIVNVDTNSTVDTGSLSWTTTQWHETQYLNTTSLVNVSAGNYSFDVELKWWNTSSSAWETLDSDSDPFVVYTSTGGGGNSSGTNCAVYAWSDFYSYMVGDNFYGEIDTYCSLTNETLWAGWDIVNVDTNSTVDTGSLSWTTTQWHETQYLNTTSLVNVSAGNYSFDVELKWWNTSSSAWETLDSDSDPFVVYTSTGGGGNSSGTNCAVYAWSDFYSYMVGDNFYGEIDTYCSLTNETLWAGWDIVNVDTNSTVDTGSLSWTTTQWHETQYLNTTSLVNVSAGNYSFDVELKWWNTSSSAWETLDSDSDPFVVYTSTGGGGNSSGTNCAVYAWSDFYSYMVGDNFYGEIDTYCSLTNETLWAGWDIVNVDTNSTVDTGSLSWTTTQWHETQYLNTTSLVNVSAGNYSFDVELKWWNTSSSAWETLDSDSDPFVVYTSTGGGGNSSGTNCAVYAWSDFYSYMVGDNFYGEIDTYCSLTNETLWVGWDIVNVDTNSTVDTGSLSWTTTQWHETQYLNTTSLVNVSAGNYSFDVELKWWNTSSSAWETLDSDSDPFVVYTSTGGGGNSSGTNCAVYAWSDFYSYMVGDNFYGEIDTYCSLTNETLWAGWDIVNVDTNSTVDTGSLSWTTTQWHETQYLNTTSLVNVSAGNYSFDVELKWWNTSSSAWETLDSDSDPFVVYDFGGGTHSSNEYVDIDHFGYQSQDANGIEIFPSGSNVYADVTSGNLSLGTTYTLVWNLADLTGSIDGGNFTWTAFNNESTEYLNISGLPDGLYGFQAVLYNGTGAMVAQDNTMVRVGNSTGNETSMNDAFLDLSFAYMLTQTAEDTVTFGYTLNNSGTWEGNFTWSASYAGQLLSGVGGFLTVEEMSFYANSFDYDIASLNATNGSVIQFSWVFAHADGSGFVTGNGTLVLIISASAPVDSDMDGVPDSLDAFPFDSTEWADTDNDGVGDNADAFPNDASEIVDSDGDGVGDNADAFPNDPSESADADGDGVGDNSDAFPNDASETSDADGDGVGDNADAFPNDPAESADADGDGVGDNADTDNGTGNQTGTIDLSTAFENVTYTVVLEQIDNASVLLNVTVQNAGAWYGNVTWDVSYDGQNLSTTPYFLPVAGQGQVSYESAIPIAAMLNGSELCVLLTFTHGDNSGTVDPDASSCLTTLVTVVPSDGTDGGDGTDATDEDDEEDEGGLPGFGLSATLIALALAGLSRRGRDDPLE